MKSVLHLVDIGAALLAACTSTHPPLLTVRAVDLVRYYGTWYEIARQPKLEAATLVALLARAAVLGFDRHAFIMIPQASAAP